MGNIKSIILICCVCSLSLCAAPNVAYKPAHLSKEMRALLSMQYDDSRLKDKEVSINLRNTKIVDVIELIGKSVGFDFLVDPDVSGTVKLVSLRDIPVAVALRQILQSNTPKLALINDCKVFRITRLAHAKEIALAQREKDFDTLTVTFLRARFDDALKKRIESMWRSIIAEYADKRGVYLSIDCASKKVFCRGRKEHVAQFKSFLSEIDKAMPQVQIEARFVCAEKGFEENFGMQWSGIYNRRASVGRGFDFIGGGRPLSDISNNPGPQAHPSLVQWALNFLPTPEKSARIMRVPFVFGGSDLNTKRLNLMLNAAESRNEIRTILKPAILTNDKEEAQILVGEDVPIERMVEESIEGRLRNVRTAEYRPIGIQLKVVPEVFPDRKSVLLDVFIENSQQTGMRRSNQSAYPVIQTTRSHTKVSLKSGQTTMISGLIRSVGENYNSGAPLLSKLPIVGLFFRGARRVSRDMQLLIFITPTVL